MQDFLIRLLITIGIIWLTQTLLGAFAIDSKARSIIFMVVVIVMVLWLAFGFFPK